jgi:hypothetical protein
VFKTDRKKLRALLAEDGAWPGNGHDGAVSDVGATKSDPGN